MAEDARKDSPSTPLFLQQLYLSYRSRVLPDIWSKHPDTIKAQQLETFLNYAKLIEQNQGNISAAALTSNGQFKQFWDISEVESFFRMLQQYSPNLFKSGLFIHRGGRSHQQGALLERGVSEVIESVMKAYVGQSGGKAAVYDTNVGGLHTQVPNLVDSIKGECRDIYTKAYYYTLIGLNETKQKSRVLGAMSSVQGKIDSVGLNSKIFMTTNMQNGMFKDIVGALQDATFTDKNYMSKKEIHFGNTNPFRAFATAYSASPETVATRYMRMINCFRFHEGQHFLAPKYFYRIRVIYEISGAGMKYTSNSLNSSSPLIHNMLGINAGARFLIWNTPMAGHPIRVMATGEILRNILNSTVKDNKMNLPGDWRDMVYGPVTIKQDILAQSSQISF